MVKKLKICIIGAESWGSAIATAVGVNAFNSAKFDNRVHLYVYDDLVSNNNTLSDVINDTHENIKYLPGIHLPENLIAIDDLLEAARDADILIFSTPKHFVKSYCNILEGQIKSTAIAVSLVKGFERIKDGEIDLFTNGISEQLQIPCYSFVSANSAMEMAQGRLCEVTIGCDNEEHSQHLEEIFQTMNCKVVILPDVEGVELCGALKGVIALGAGFVDGLNLGDNTRVAVIHLGLKEIMRFVKSFYPNTKLSTFFESCGVADLVASCYDDNNVKFAKAFVTSGKTLQELESNLPYNKELLGPQIVEQVYNFLSKSNKEQQYPLFMAIHKICQNEQHPETIIEALRNHPDLHYPSITNLLNSELTTTRNHPDISVLKIDVTDYMKYQNKDNDLKITAEYESPEESVHESDSAVYSESQNKDNLITDEYQPIKAFFKADGTDYTELQNKDNFLRITAEHEPREESVHELNNTISSESQNKDESIKITPEYNPIKSFADNTESEIEDIYKVSDDRYVADIVYKIDETAYLESHDKNNLLEEKQGQSGGSKVFIPEHLVVQFSNNSKFDNIVNSTSKEPTHDDWMADDEWRPQDFEIKEIEYPTVEQPKKTSDNPFQEDWMGDNEWRPHDFNLKIIDIPVKHKLTDNFAPANQYDHCYIGGTSESNSEKEKVQIILDFKFGDNEKNITINKLLSNFVAMTSKDHEEQQKEHEKPVMYKSLSDYQKRTLLKPKKQKELFDPDFEGYAMNAESLTSSPDLTRETVESNDFKIKSVEIESPIEVAFESEIGNPSIQEPVMEINDYSSQKKSIDQSGRYEIEDTIGDSFFDSSQYLEDSQYENIYEVPTIEMKNTSSKDNNLDQAKPNSIDTNDDRSTIDWAHNEFFEELANSGFEDKKNKRKMENITEFDEIFEELSAAHAQDKNSNEVIPRLEIEKADFSVEFDSIINEIGKTALENERSRQVAKMSKKDDKKNNERSRQVTNNKINDNLKKESQVAKMSMKDDLGNERSQHLPKLNTNDSIAAEHIQILKEEFNINSAKEKSKQKPADTDLNISDGIDSAIDSKDNNKIDSGNNSNNEQLIIWKNLFEETEKQKTMLNASSNDKIEEKSAFDAFKSSNDGKWNKHQNPEWNWIQLSNEQEHENKIDTGSENIITNKINTGTGNENVKNLTINADTKKKTKAKGKIAQKDKLQKSNADTKNKSERKKKNAHKDSRPYTLSQNKFKRQKKKAQKDNVPITLSQKSNAEVHATSPDAMSVNVKIVDLEELGKDTKKKSSKPEYDFDASIDSVYSFVEENQKESKASESFEALAGIKNIEKQKPEPKRNPESEEIEAPVDQYNTLDSKPEIKNQEKVNETKEDSYMTTKLKYLMDTKNSKQNKSQFWVGHNMDPFDTSVYNVDDKRKSNIKKQYGKKYMLKTPFHPPLNPRVKIPQPPFDGREHEYHTLACRMPRPLLYRQNDLRRIQGNCTCSEFLRKAPPLCGCKSFLNIMRANKIFRAFQAGMFAAMFYRYGKL